MRDKILSSRQISFRLTLVAFILEGLWLGGEFVLNLLNAPDLYYLLWVALIGIVWLAGGTFYRFRMQGGATRSELYSLLISIFLIVGGVVVILKS